MSLPYIRPTQAIFLPERGSLPYRLLHQLVASPEERPCSQDPEAWWLTDPSAMERAKRICKAHCPLIDQCRAYAVSSREPSGVWGGLTPSERFQYHRKDNFPRLLSILGPYLKPTDLIEAEDDEFEDAA